MTITNSSSAKLVAVSGATGAQGGAIIQALKRSAKEYRVRGFTRSASKASALKDEGVEVVELDLSSKNQAGVQRAFEGADVVFGMTNFWEHMDKEREIADGKAMIQAAIDAKVSLFIWAGLSSYTKISSGKYKHVEHFDGKAEVSEFGRSLKSSAFSFAVVQPAGYMQNLTSFSQPTGQEVNGKPAFAYALPTEGKIALIDITDYGLWVQATIENKELQDDEDVLAAVDEHTGKEQTEIISKNSSVHMHFAAVDEATYKSYLPDAMKIEMTEMYLSMGEFGYFGGKDFKKFHKYLEFAPHTMEEWAKTAKFNIPSA